MSITKPRVAFPRAVSEALTPGWLAAFCRRWQVTEFAVFGSVIREDFRADSDLDVLATFHT